MKKLLFFLALFISLASSAQITPPTGFVPINQRYNWLGGKFDSTFIMPSRDTVVAPTRVGELRFRAADSTMYVSRSLVAAKKWYEAGLTYSNGFALNLSSNVFSVDSATLFTHAVRRKDSVAGGYYPYSSNPLGFLTADSVNVWDSIIAPGWGWDIYTSYVGPNPTDSLDYGEVDSTEVASWLRLYKVADSLAALISGAGTSNSNIGSGYLLLKPAGQEIKTLFNGYAVGIDSSSNTNGLTFKIDTALISTKAFRDKLKDSIGAVLTAGYQPLDGDLTAIAALSGTNTIYYRSASNTWTAVTPGHELNFASGTLGLKKTVQTLSDGATITWDMDNGFNTEVTITADRTLDIVDEQEGDYGTIAVTQDGTGGHALTVPDGTVTLDATAGATTIISFYFDGTTFFWASGSGGGGTWGSITGTLSDQTDLQAALDAKEVDLTFSTGLTRATNTITSNLSTGVSGGQTLIGGTGSGDDITYSSTSNATKGDHIWGTTAKMYFDEVNSELHLGSATDQGAYQLQVATHSVFGFGAAQASMNFTNNSNTTGYSQLSFTMANGTGLGSLTGYDASHGSTLGGVSTNSLMALGAGAGNLLVFSYGGGNVYFWAGVSASADMSLKSTGRLGLKGITAPDAFLHIPAGTTTTPQFKANASTLLTTTQAGAMEYDGTHWYVTNANAGARFQIDQKLAQNLTTNYTAVGNIGTGVDDLMSYTVPAGQLATDGDYIEFEMTFQVAINADTKNLVLLWGGTSFLSVPNLSAAGGFITARGTIIRTSATTQLINVTFFSTNDGISSAQASGTQTLSGTVILKATGEGVSNDDISQKSLTVKYYAN